MKKTTTDIVKLLPLNDDFKSQLVSSWDSLNADQKFEMEQVIWNAYDALYEMYLEKNLENQMDEAQHGKRNLEPQFYEEAQKKADQEFKNYLDKHVTQDELAGVRDKLQSLIQSPIS